MSNEHIEELLFVLAGLYSRSYPKGEEPTEVKSNGFERIISLSEDELTIRVELPLGRAYTLYFKLKGFNWEYYDYYYYN